MPHISPQSKTKTAACSYSPQRHGSRRNTSASTNSFALPAFGLVRVEQAPGHSLEATAFREQAYQRSARPHLMETSIAPTSLAPLAIALRGSVGMSCPNQETDCQQQTQSSLTTVLFLSASLIFSPSTLSSCLSWSLPRPQSEDLINATRSSSNRLWALIAF